MSSNNTDKIITKLYKHIANINRFLKGIKSNISADCIQLDNRDIIITTNRVAAKLNMKIVEKYMKDLNNVDLTEILYPGLP